MQSFNLNLVSAAEIIKSLADNLKQNKGSIVLFSTVAVKQGFPNHAIVSSAKGAVEGLTLALAAEFAPNIRVNCICPGPINTNMTAAIDEKDKETYARRRVGLKRYGEPEEVAHATLNLCLPSSSYINGVYLPVDGGLSIRRA